MDSDSQRVPFPFPVKNRHVTNQVVKSGYFQLRQTPGVPLGHAMGPGLGLWGPVVSCLNTGAMACRFAQVSIGTSDTEGREIGETQGPGPFDGALGGTWWHQGVRCSGNVWTC